MSPGDQVFYRDDTFGRHRWWEVLSCCYGGTGQEGLIELRCLNETPGQDTEGKHHETTWVPAVLLRGLPVFAHPERFKEMDDLRLAAERTIHALRNELQRYQDLDRHLKGLGFGGTEASTAEPGKPGTP